jgi:putative flippase GtrA
MIKRIRNSPLTKKVMKFGVVGGITTMLSYGIYILLSEVLGMNYLVAQVISYLMGLVVGFFMNRNWTFSSHLEEDEKYFSRYLMVYLVSLGLSNAFLWVLVDNGIFESWFANILATGLSTATNFIGTNYIVFKPAPKDNGNEK